MYPHVIRLRGPWECLPADGATSEPPSEPLRVTPPCDVHEVIGADFRGRVLLRRSFHAPVALVANEALWLVVESVGAPARVTLDGALLGEIEPGRDVLWEWNITTRQRERMLLEIELTVGEEVSGPTLGAVRLEVRDARIL
jgi:hypothetical protein